MSTTTEEKTIYLQKLLQENEIDSSQFTSFLQQSNVEALNLEYITQERIDELVEQFKSERRPQKKSKKKVHRASMQSLPTSYKSENNTLSSEGQKLKRSRALKEVKKLEPTRLSKLGKLVVIVEKPMLLENSSLL